MPETLELGLAASEVDFGETMLRTTVRFSDIQEAKFFFTPAVRKYSVWWNLVSEELFKCHLFYIDKAHRDLES
jgi:hypothetical protein